MRQLENLTRERERERENGLQNRRRQR